jgi:hypothetical protein
LKYCARPGAEGGIFSEDRESFRGINKTAKLGFAWFVLVSEW